MDDKIIVSNRTALKAKYGSDGLAKIGKAVDVLDQGRCKARDQEPAGLSGPGGDDAWLQRPRRH